MKKTGRTDSSVRPSIQAVWCSHGSLGGQDSSAFCTAAGKNLAAVGGCHSLAESMDLSAMTLSGLIGTQHLVYTSCKIMLNSRKAAAIIESHNMVMQMVLYRKKHTKVN